MLSFKAPVARTRSVRTLDAAYHRRARSEAAGAPRDAMSRDVTYLNELAAFAHDFKPADLPSAVLERCKWILADCMAVIGAGMQQREMRVFTRLHLASSAAGRASVIGARLKTAAPGAAFLNGIAGTWLELDEGHTQAKGHPGIQLMPAAFAYAQEHATSGLELLAAIAIGYEISSRINRAAKIRSAIHPHGTFGVIGAALSVARLKHLRQDEFRCLVNIAAALPLASSYRTLEAGATVRNVFTGHSAFMGMTAVNLVEAGFTTEPDAVGTTYGELIGDDFDPARVLEALGSHWMTAEGYFKLHPTARSVHSAIDAVEDALAAAPAGCVTPENIARIDVRTYRLAAAKAQKEVRTAFGAKFSVPFAIATFIVHGRGSLDCFDDAAVNNPAVQKLAGLVELAEDAGMTQVYPARQPCEIVRGEPEKPNTLDEVQAKFTQLAVPVWGGTMAGALFKDCMAMDSIADVARWSESLTL